MARLFHHIVSTCRNLFLNHIRMIMMLVVSCIPMFLITDHCHGRNDSFQTHQIKAVFIYNLTHFVTWPAEAFESPATPIKICILGDDPSEGLLDKVVQGETISGRRLVIARISDIQDLSPCQILFVSSSMKKQLPLILAFAEKNSVLTVGDVEGFALKGGMVNLIHNETRMQVEINLESTKKAGLQISSKLLNLATIVTNEEDNPW